MKNLWISIKITLAMCVLLTVGYVLILRLTAAVASPNDGEAPTVTFDGRVVGAANVGQQFTDVRYFWGASFGRGLQRFRFGRQQQGYDERRISGRGGAACEDFLAAHPYLSREEVPLRDGYGERFGT